jgi:hypothetical protein
MKIRALAVIVILASPWPASAQQTDAGGSGQKIFNWCMTLDTGSPSECGCVAGFYAAATEDDEFDLLAEMVPFFDKDGQVGDMESLRTALFAKKASLAMTDERFNTLMDGFTTFDQLGADADAICIPVEQAAGDARETE